MNIQSQTTKSPRQSFHSLGSMYAAQSAYQLLDDIVASKAYLQSNFADLAHALGSGELHKIQGRYTLYRSTLKSHLKLISVGMYVNLKRLVGNKFITSITDLESAAIELNQKVSEFLTLYKNSDSVNCKYFEKAVYEIEFLTSRHYESERRALNACCYAMLNQEAEYGASEIRFKKAG